MSRTYGFCLAFVLAFSSSLAGQEAPGPPPPTSEDSADAAEPPTTKAPAEQPPGAEPADAPGAEPADAHADAPADAPADSRQEHVIYVPFENLGDVFGDEDSSIVLPYAQFLEMWDRLTKPEKKPIRPPVSGVITQADYVGSIKGELVHLEANLAVEVLSDEWSRLPVEFGDAAIGSARSEDGAVLLQGVGQGRYELLVRGKGKHEITLSLTIGVQSDTEGRSFTVPCPAAGASSLELEIPEDDLAVQVTPRRTCELRSGAEGPTRVRAVLGSTDQFTVSWQPKSGGTDQAAGLASVTDAIAVDVGEGVVHTHAVFEYQILRGSLEELVVEVPGDHRLLDVQAPGLRDWQTETVDDRQRVKVRLHAPAAGKTRLELHAETPIAEEAFRVGHVRAVGVARESGVLAVRSSEDVALEIVDRESITRVDAAEAPESLRKPGATFYKFFTPDHKLSVTASEREPRVVVDSHLAILLDKTRLTARGEFRYRVSRSGVFSLSFRLPAGFQVDEVRTDSMERFEVAPADDAQTLTVYFTQKLLGELAVAVTASQVRDKPAGELALPLIEPLGATREQGLVAVIAPESLEVKTDASQLRAARAATPAELASKGFQPEVPEGSALAAAFSFVTRPVEIVQTITERPRRTEVVVGTAAHVKEDVVQVTATLGYQIQFAGTDTFRIAVPAEVSDRLQVEGEGIKERRRADEPNDDGTVEWTVVLHSEAVGERTFTAIYDRQLTIPEGGTQFELTPIRALDVDREAGEIAIQKDRALSIEAEPTGLEEIDPRELSQPIAATQPYLTYRYYRHPARLALSVTKHELQEVVETVVRRAYVEVVVTEDGPMTMRARYDLNSSERQRLAVTLRNPRILGMAVAGQTLAPEKAPAAPGSAPEDRTYFINVARSGDADEPFQIGMVFETPLPQEQLQVNGVLSLPLPRFAKGVKFQQVYVRVWVPKDYRLVGIPEGFVSHIGVGLWDSRKITHAADNPDSWFPQDNSSFDFQVGGTTYLFSSLTEPGELETAYWHIPTMTLVASLAVLAVGLALVWFSLETKVFAILAAVFAVLFVGLFTPSVVNSWLLAARLGIAGVVALWLVVWVLFIRRAGLALPSRVAEKRRGPSASGAGGGRASSRATGVPPRPAAPPGGEKPADAEVVGDESAAPEPPQSPFASDAGPDADAPKDNAPEDDSRDSGRGHDEQ